MAFVDKVESICPALRREHKIPAALWASPRHFFSGGDWTTLESERMVVLIAWTNGCTAVDTDMGSTGRASEAWVTAAAATGAEEVEAMGLLLEMKPSCVGNRIAMASGAVPPTTALCSKVEVDVACCEAIRVCCADVGCAVAGLSKVPGC